MRLCRRISSSLFAGALSLATAGVLAIPFQAQAAAGGNVAGNAGGNTGGMPVAQGSNGGGGVYNPANRNSQSDYPAAEVQTVPIAMARAATARAVQDQVLNDLHVTVDHLWEDFDYSGSMISLRKEVDSAYLEYDDARRKALETLSNDPTYRAMISLVVTLKNKLESERPAAAKPLPEDLERVMATATLKLSYASSASAMEAAALAADDRVQQTRARLVLAGQKAATMREEFARSVRRSDEFLAARRSFDDSRIARITAEAFLDGAIDARDYALNYAYYIHRFDQYSYSPALLGSGLYYGAGNGFYNGVGR